MAHTVKPIFSLLQYITENSLIHAQAYLICVLSTNWWFAWWIFQYVYCNCYCTATTDLVPWKTDTRSTYLAQTQFYRNWQIYLCGAGRRHTWSESLARWKLIELIFHSVCTYKQYLKRALRNEMWHFEKPFMGTHLSIIPVPCMLTCFWALDLFALFIPCMLSFPSLASLIKHTVFKYKCQLLPSVFCFKCVQWKQSYYQIVVLALILWRGSARSYVCFTSQSSPLILTTQSMVLHSCLGNGCIFLFIECLLCSVIWAVIVLVLSNGEVQWWSVTIYLPLYFERKDLMTSVTKFSHQKHLDSPFQLGKYEPECVLTPETV